MFEKNLEMSLLLDFYGQILTERKSTVMNLYYNEDYSLSEIADELGISRQGVRDLIKKSETELLLLEKSLGLAKRFENLRDLCDNVENTFKGTDLTECQKNALDNLIKAVRE